MSSLIIPFKILVKLAGIVIIPIILFSCYNERRRKSEDLDSYYLKKENEFIIHSLSSVEILDYFLEDSLYLGYTNTHSGKEICLINESGDIIISKNMQGEGPDQHSSNLSCLAFAENGDIWAMTGVEVLRYNQQLNLLEKFTFKANSMITLYKSSKIFSYFRKESNQTGITFPVNPSGVSRYEYGNTENYTSGKLLELYDQSKKQSKEIVPVSDRRITEEFFWIVRGFFAPVYAIDSETSKLFLTSTFENELTIYDLNADTVVARLDIFHGDQTSVSPPSPISKQKLSQTSENWLLTPMNHSIHNLDSGLIALEYLIGVSVNPKPGKLDAQIRQDFYQNRLILFDQNQQISGDLAIPEQGIVRTSLPGNRLLIKVDNLEKEEDFSRYVIFKVMLD